jgi:hypothetical protein
MRVPAYRPIRTLSAACFDVEHASPHRVDFSFGRIASSFRIVCSNFLGSREGV